MSSAPRDPLQLFAARVEPDPDWVWQERLRVRDFIAEAIASGLMTAENDSWLSGFSPAFSAALGDRGWIGMTWPVEYGGRSLTNRARFAVVEELVAAGAPVAAHWFSDRQIGPSLLRHGTEQQRARFLPEMARGRLYFCIGMSEPNSGSDLASIHTRATATDGGWRVQGSKIWTSNAHGAHYMLALTRTGGPDDAAQIAMTQLLIDMSSPGVTVRPIRTLDGGAHFCEVFLDDVFVPDEMVLGAVGAGWGQVLGELAYERSGPERFLSTFPLLRDLLSLIGDEADTGRDYELGRTISRLVALRAMSARVNQQLDAGQAPAVAAALVKDVGTRLEKESIETVVRWQPPASDLGLLPAVQSIVDTDSGPRFDAMLAHAQAHSPGFTLRGGTNEILRGIVARAIGLS